MSCNVFANGNEIACKKGGNKVIAEFPDVCLSPPSPPAGPIPVPYPNSSFSKDMKSGSKKVKIKGGEVMLKDKSFYKSSPLGDEAATKSFGGNVISHNITGKTFFVAWSMDVKFEGMNVDRHIDMTTSNHMSPPGGTGPTGVSMGASSTATPAEKKACQDAKDKKKEKCESPGPPTLKKGAKKIGDLKNVKMTAHLTKAEINARIQGIDDCLAARHEVTNKCFGGVTDPRHAGEEQQLRDGRQNTVALLNRMYPP